MTHGPTHPPTDPPIHPTTRYAGQVTTIGKVIKNTKCEVVYQHGKFTAGEPPAVLAAKKVLVYIPVDGEPFARALAAVRDSKQMTMLWEVTVRGQRLEPAGPVVLTSKQLIVKPGEELAV